MLINMGFMDLQQQYCPQLHLSEYCCLVIQYIKLHIALIVGAYFYNMYPIYITPFYHLY